MATDKTGRKIRTRHRGGSPGREREGERKSSGEKWKAARERATRPTELDELDSSGLCYALGNTVVTCTAAIRCYREHACVHGGVDLMGLKPNP